LGIRNTSIIGWIPLLFIQIIKTKSFTNYIKAGILIALPSLIIIIGIDSIYYGELTCTAWNFLKINVLLNKSAEFGVDPPTKFIFYYLPKAFGYSGCLTLIGFFYYVY
jgi:hypothetical protein